MNRHPRRHGKGVVNMTGFVPSLLALLATAALLAASYFLRAKRSQDADA